MFKLRFDKDESNLGVHGRSLRSFQTSVAFPSGSIVAVIYTADHFFIEIN